MIEDLWYERVDSTARLTQGDIILACPLMTWANKPFTVSGGAFIDSLKGIVEAISEDVVVMTQACDLENDKVSNVVLCPHWALADYKEDWIAATKAKDPKFNPSDKAWKSYCNDIKDGYQWNLSMLNEGSVGGLSIAHRVVEFQELYTVPRDFLEILNRERGTPRLRLRPPYREHLSQAFARFFMRVGLPVAVNTKW